MSNEINSELILVFMGLFSILKFRDPLHVIHDHYFSTPRNERQWTNAIESESYLLLPFLSQIEKLTKMTKMIAYLAKNI